MPVRALSYKGKQIQIKEQGCNAELTVEGNKFPCTLHEGSLNLWSCKGVYFCSPELDQLARHVFDYLYILTSKNTAPVEDGHDHGTPGGGHEHGAHNH